MYFLFQACIGAGMLVLSKNVPNKETSIQNDVLRRIEEANRAGTARRFADRGLGRGP